MNNKKFNKWCDVRGIGLNTRKEMVFEIENGRYKNENHESEDIWLDVYHSLTRYYLHDIFYPWVD